MKRDRSDNEESMKHIDIVESLMMLSRSFVVKQIDVKQSTAHFECKTCNRKFDSFQALGGHRASHKKPKLSVDQEQVKHRNNENDMHKCSICDQMFGTGQALGGHMRKHRATMITEQSVIPSVVYSRPVLNRCNSSKKILDLNLTPLENDLVFIFGKNLVPQIDLKFVN